MAKHLKPTAGPRPGETGQVYVDSNGVVVVENIIFRDGTSYLISEGLKAQGIEVRWVYNKFEY